jgi:hypothetical protein
VTIVRDIVETNPENDRSARARQARQVIAGPDVRPPARLSSTYLPEEGGITPPQRTYFIALIVLLVIAVALYAFFGMGVASVIFFLLALTLIAGWLVF